MRADLEKVLIPEAELQAKIRELAAQIDQDYAGRELLLVGVLKGAVMVMADLARALHSPVSMDWMAVSSYGSGTKSSGVVRILKDLDANIKSQDKQNNEDNDNTSHTQTKQHSNQETRGPASLEICTLLRKPDAAK